jgi:hypothetical protein
LSDKGKIKKENRELTEKLKTVSFGFEICRQPRMIPSQDERDELGRRSGNPWPREYPNVGSEEISKV